MTFGAAVTELIRRAWAVAVVAVMVGAGAYLVASRHHAAFQASAVVSHKPAKARHGQHGLKQLVLSSTPSTLAIGTDYLRPPAGVSLTPNGRTVLVVADGRTRTAASGAITSYLNRLKQRWAAQFDSAQSRTLAAIQARSKNRHVTASEVTQAITAARAVHPSISIGAVAFKQTSTPLGAGVAAILGAICGALLGIGLVLASYALRGQIWRAEELTPLGMEVVEVDSGKAADVHRLRVQLEAHGLGSTLRSVVVAPAGNRDGWTPLAQALADSFRLTAVDAVLISAVPTRDRREAGLNEFLANPQQPLNVRRIADHLSYVAAGPTEQRESSLTARRVRALLTEASQHGSVTVVDGPPLNTPLASLLVAAADLCVVVVHRRNSTAGPLTSAVVAVRRLASRNPLLCFDTARTVRPGSPSAPANVDRTPSQRDVPANANP